MLRPGTTARSRRGTVVEILEDGPERFRLRRQMPPGTGKTANHRHLDGVETFRLVEGEATGAVYGESQRLRAGDVMTVPVGAPHVHPHTAPGATAVLEHTIEPRPRFVEVYFASWLKWLEEGRVDEGDEPTLLGVMAVIRAGGGGTWVVGPPVALQKGLAAVLGRVAAARGLKPVT